jgi:hypothetical protein
MTIPSADGLAKLKHSAARWLTSRLRYFYRLFDDESLRQSKRVVSDPAAAPRGSTLRWSMHSARRAYEHQVVHSSGPLQVDIT